MTHGSAHPRAPHPWPLLVACLCLCMTLLPLTLTSLLFLSPPCLCPLSSLPAPSSCISVSKGRSSWTAQNGTFLEYLDADLRSLYNISSLALQGRSGSEEYVTEYKLMHSIDGYHWITFAGDDRAEQVLLIFSCACLSSPFPDLLLLLILLFLSRHSLHVNSRLPTSHCVTRCSCSKAIETATT